MKLEVGKSYRTRAGEKVTIVSKGDYGEYSYHFKGSNGETYQEDGRLYYSYEDAVDLVSPWDDDPTTPKYKEGDIVEIQLTAKAAEALNLSLPCVICLEDVLLAVKDQEPEFDWSTVKAGMAFERQEKIFWYVAADITEKEYAIFTDSEEWHNFDCYFIGNFKRAPEHDMEVK